MLSNVHLIVILSDVHLIVILSDSEGSESRFFGKPQNDI